VPTAASIDTYARIVAKAARRRRMIDLGTQLAQAGYEDGLDHTVAADKIAAELTGQAVGGPGCFTTGQWRSWAELLATDQTFRWQVRGLLAKPTYGPIGGEKKSLKSYVATFVNLAMASGEKLFGHFEVDESGPVIAYVGEGGRVPYTRRLERGELLASLSTPIVQAGASLLVVDHFNKTGAGRGLDRITQAGV
jgi:AAA domain